MSDSDDIKGTFDDPNWTNPGTTEGERAMFERLRQQHMAKKAIAERHAAVEVREAWKDPAFKPLAGFRPIATAARKITTEARAKRKETSPGKSTLRVIEAAVTMQSPDYRPEIAYQHSVLCQTCLPYRDPTDAVLKWERTNGLTSLLLRAGEARHPDGTWIQLGLPFGPKPRLVLAYLNTQAILKKSPVIDVEDSLTAFLKTLRLDTKGRNLNTLKDQISRLAACDFRIGLPINERAAKTVKGQIVSSFDLWLEKDEKQRLLWPRTIQLDPSYFDSLVNHAVPLDTNALTAIAHSALALDIYAWLAQRLHRVDPRAPSFIAWTSLAHQFGDNFVRIRKFRETFIAALKQVKAVYPDAKFTLDQRGMTLSHSRPPIAYRIGPSVAKRGSGTPPDGSAS